LDSVTGVERADGCQGFRLVSVNTLALS
jgi:hypothetical protein